MLTPQNLESNVTLMFTGLASCDWQVIKEWKRRIGAEYLETIPDCELIPNQRYKLSGQPVTLIQPEVSDPAPSSGSCPVFGSAFFWSFLLFLFQTSEFVNFCDYNNFLPSFQVQLPHEVTHVELQLTSHMTPLPLIGWLFSFTASVVWQRVVQLKDQPGQTCYNNMLTKFALSLAQSLLLRSIMLTHLKLLISNKNDKSCHFSSHSSRLCWSHWR